jgi:mycobactin phenyloxazoline synthetase
MATARVLQRVREHAASRPDHSALITEAGSISYGNLVAQIDRAVSASQPASVRLIEADRSGAAVVAALAAQGTGEPVLIMPAGNGAGYLASVHADVDEFLLGTHLLSEPAADRFAGSAAGVHSPSMCEGLWTTTSGSTGRPKIVMHDPAGIDRFIDWVLHRFEFNAEDRVLSHAPLNFDIALLDVWSTLVAGGTVVFAPAGALADGERLARWIAERQVTIVQAVPQVLRLLMQSSSVPLTGVRLVASTGDFFPIESIGRLVAAFPMAEAVSIYGSTETNDSFLVDLRNQVLPAGVAILGDPISTTTYRVDGVPAGVAGTGELVVSTPFQALGYINASNAAWQRLPDGRREFHTGDVVCQATDGALTLQGRTDRQVKVRGIRVSLDDVESVISRLDGVVEAVVLGSRDPDIGTRIAAVIQVRSEGGPGSIAIREHCSRNLSSSAAIPSRIVITSDPLPRTSTGKVDRTGATRVFLEGAFA